MAILLSFHKEAETDRTVTYLVRPDPSRPAVTLVIDKLDPSTPIVGDLTDRAVARALGTVLRDRRKSGSWPTHGSHQA